MVFTVENGSEKGSQKKRVSRRRLERRLGEYDPLGVRYRETISAIPPYCALQHRQLGAIPPSPFLSVSPLKHMQSRGAIPPPLKKVSQRYLRDTLGKQGKWV